MTLQRLWRCFTAVRMLQWHGIFWKYLKFVNDLHNNICVFYRILIWLIKVEKCSVFCSSAVEVSILVGCATAWLGEWCHMFWGSLVVSNIRHLWPSDVMQHPRRRAATVLRLSRLITRENLVYLFFRFFFFFLLFQYSLFLWTFSHDIPSAYIHYFSENVIPPPLLHRASWYYQSLIYQMMHNRGALNKY